MSECTAGPPLAPLQPWLWQNSSWVKVTAEMPLIVPKHPSESYIAVGRSRERPREVTVQRRSAGLDGNWLVLCSLTLEQRRKSLWVCHICESWFKCKIMLCSDILPTPCGMCICLSESVPMHVSVCLCALCTLDSMHAWLLFVCTAVSVSGGGWWPSTKYSWT